MRSARRAAGSCPRRRPRPAARAHDRPATARSTCASRRASSAARPTSRSRRPSAARRRSWHGPPTGPAGPAVTGTRRVSAAGAGGRGTRRPGPRSRGAAAGRRRPAAPLAAVGQLGVQCGVAVVEHHRSCPSVVRVWMTTTFVLRPAPGHRSITQVLGGPRRLRPLRPTLTGATPNGASQRGSRVRRPGRAPCSLAAHAAGPACPHGPTDTRRARTCDSEPPSSCWRSARSSTFALEFDVSGIDIQRGRLDPDDRRRARHRAGAGRLGPALTPPGHHAPTPTTPLRQPGAPPPTRPTESRSRGLAHRRARLRPVTALLTDVEARVLDAVDEQGRSTCSAAPSPCPRSAARTPSARSSTWSPTSSPRSAATSTAGRSTSPRPRRARTPPARRSSAPRRGAWSARRPPPRPASPRSCWPGTRRRPAGDPALWPATPSSRAWTAVPCTGAAPAT